VCGESRKHGSNWEVRGLIAPIDPTSEGNVRGAQGLSRLTNLNILSRYEDNRQQYQEQASNLLADLI
jgi:hypothetical protein